jgi:uncharacterized membrane protein YfcA
VLLGALLGAQLLIRLRGSFIRQIFVVVLVLTALEMFLRAFGLGL